jgi:hypothetical protein
MYVCIRVICVYLCLYVYLYVCLYIYYSSLISQGETFELKAELNADTKDKRKDAVKRVIANMTVGKDVSMLFADVVKNMQTEDLEMKKLVYLYLINYAKSQPELVILAVNTFVKVCSPYFFSYLLLLLPFFVLLHFVLLSFYSLFCISLFFPVLPFFSALPFFCPFSF